MMRGVCSFSCRASRVRRERPHGHRVQNPGDVQPVGFLHGRLHDGALFVRNSAQIDQQGACSAAQHFHCFLRVVEHGGNGSRGQQEVGRQGLYDGVGQGENQRGRLPDFFQI